MSFQKFQQLVQESDAKFVDLRFTDTKGVWHHVSVVIDIFDEGTVKTGIAFDGSSIPGWKPIHNSDAVLIPDLSTAVIDAFSAQPQIIVFCSVVNTDQLSPYNRCSRQIAQRAEKYLKTSGIGDSTMFGPEAEFFIFDSVRISTEAHFMAFRLESEEAPSASYQKLEQGNSGHRPEVKGGYFPCIPIDGSHDVRAEMLTTLKQMGVHGEKHHHEVGSTQAELGHRCDQLVRAADDLQIYKYVIRNVAHSYGKTATFMPKPVQGDNGSGMHVHISLWKNGENIFAGDKYAHLSQDALYFIGGVLSHARAINAISNPTTNSFKRLVPGFEAPTLLAYSAHNRSASCRIPHSSAPKARRVEFRFPDAAANPYLLFSSLLMAGLDGIKNKIDPGAPRDEDLYALSKEELKKIPSLCHSLRAALDALSKDHQFLLEGGVFDEDFIKSYIDLKMNDVQRLEQAPHPMEFELYYSC